MLLQYDSNKLVNVYRRNQLLSNSAFADIYNEPIYGSVTTDWQLTAASLPVLLDQKNSPIVYNQAGERQNPNYIMYAPASSSILEEDRIIDLRHTGSASMYVVTSVADATDGMGITEHLELELRTP